MFTKLVTNLPYSPGLINQIGQYLAGLKKEEFMRRLGLIFVVLALLVNLQLSLFAPQPSVLASPGNDIINGGIAADTLAQTQEKATIALVADSYVTSVYGYYGISEADIQAASLETIQSDDPSYRSASRQGFGRGAESCIEHEDARFCERNLHTSYGFGDQDIEVLSGTRSNPADGGDPWFGIIVSSGNVVRRINATEELRLEHSLAPTQSPLVSPGQLVEFRLNLSSPGENGALFPTITATLPSDMNYVDHSPKDVFDLANIDNGTLNLSGSQPLYGVGPQQTQELAVFARVSREAQPSAGVCSSASASSRGGSAISKDAVCVEIVDAESQITCSQLRMVGLGGTNGTRTFEAASSTGAAGSVTFSFGDGSPSRTIESDGSTATINHTFEPGQYVVSAQMGSNPEGCELPVQINGLTSSPLVACDYLRAVPIFAGSSRWDFSGAATAENGAQLQEFTIDYGDGASDTVAATSAQFETSHSYASAGTYTARLLVASSLGSTSNTFTCETEVTVPALDAGDAAIPLSERVAVANISQSLDDAHNTTAQPGDILEYKVVVKNNSNLPVKDHVVIADFADVLHYATFVRYDGGILVNRGLSVEWPAADIAPHEVVEKTIRVQIKTPVPNTPSSTSDPLSFDLTMELAADNNVTVHVPETQVKVIENVVNILPTSPLAANLASSALLVSAIVFFYARNRLVTKELKLIKNEFSGGALNK